MNIHPPTKPLEPRATDVGPTRFVCPCDFPLECVGNEGFMDDTASTTRYECTRPGETHCWSWLSYTAWTHASCWVFRGVKTDQS